MLRTANPFPGYNPEDSSLHDLPDAPEKPSIEQMGEWDAEPENWLDHNARRGASIIKAYGLEHDRSETVKTAFIDMLSDLRHAADALGLEFDHIFYRSGDTYYGDRNP